MIGLTAGVMMFFTAIQAPSVAQAATVPVGIVEATTTSAVIAVPAASSVEIAVRSYFKDTPILAEVAFCESSFAQFGKDGKVLRGKEVASDVGVMQINEHYHGDTAKKLGMDLYTIEGNMAYAKYLYQKNGLSDWEASKPCWSKALSKQLAKAN